MKIGLFFKRYVSVLFLSAACYAVAALCGLFYGKSFSDFISPSLLISILIGYELRIVDDINDFYGDVIKRKTLFSRKTLAFLLCADMAAIVGLSIVCARYLFLIPAGIVAVLLAWNKEYVKAFVLPTAVCAAFYYNCGVRFALIPLAAGAVALSLAFALLKSKKREKPELKDVGGKAYKLSIVKGCRIPEFIAIPYYELDDEERVRAYIKAFCKKRGKYAVRSSGIDEDSLENSFAGVHESYLNVPADKVFGYVRKVRESGRSERAAAYRKYNNLEQTDGRVSVIIQKMVYADFAGVINTVNPVTNDINETVISVCGGLGDKLVDGQTDGTTYYINGIKETVNGEDILNKKQKKNLLMLGKTVARQTERFQDIEFALVKNRAYLLQTRDIATYKDINSHGLKFIIDNSNIIESYYDVTLPLTFSFAKDIYAKVYSATLSLGKIRSKIMNSLKNSLDNMLYYYDGRIYYNLRSWYHVTSIFPTKNSTKYMESMMGVKTSSSGNKRVKLSVFDAIKILFIFLGKLKRMDELSDDFIRRFNEIVKPYYGKEINAGDEELKKLYESIEKKIIPEFTTPILNDCAVMFYFGMLKEKAKKFPNPTDIVNECVNSDGDVESAKSATAMKEIAAYIRQNEDLSHDFGSLSDEELFEKYYVSENPLSEKLRLYVDLYGPRVMNELKLETITMIENPRLVIPAVKNTLLCGGEETPRHKAEIPKKLKKLSEKARHYVRNRERLRLRRTYIFSVVRNIFLAYGRNYANEGKIDRPEDIFYLTKEEIFDKSADFKALICERKLKEEEYKKKPYYNRVAFYENRELPVSSLCLSGGGLSGIPSGAGVVKARVCLLENPTDKFIPGSIILTRRTDPGWITLFPQAAGIIVEHGSMLSHSFVVAREMGLPAVVGVPCATELIKDGDIVTLDGVKGEITIEN